MRKKIFVFLCVLCVLCALAGCSKREVNPIVSFDANGGSPVSDKTNVAEVFPYSQKEGYKIEGWYVDKMFQERAVFPYHVVKDTTLYARWVSVEDGNEEIEYERVAGGYGFYAVSLKTKPFSVCIPDEHLSEPVYGIKRGFMTNRSSVDTLYFGKNVRDVGEELFRYGNLTTIEVSGESEDLKVEYNALIDKKTNTLLAYPLKRKETTLTIDGDVAEDALCYNDVLETIVLTENASATGRVFRDTTAIRNYIVNENNGTLSSKDGILYSKDGTILFAYPTGRKDETFTIPEGVTTVEEDAFENAYLREIALGKDVERYEDYSYSPKLTLFTVSKENGTYESKEGVLYEKERKRLVRYPQGRSGKAVVPEGTEEIGMFAFNNAGKVTEVELPASLKRIDGYAFENCIQLDRVTFAEESGIEEIRDSAFSGCKKLGRLVMTARTPPETGEFLLDSVAESFVLTVPSNAREIYAYYWNFAYEYLDDSGFPLTTYTVTFISNGGTEIEPVHGVFVKEVKDPTKEGMIFNGWYADESLSLSSKTTFPYVITHHVTLYADWIPSDQL